ncbi:MAPEG family protein [Allosphingosinicella sp.]|uniref:MAPEG family protein n=1 Tax=Allosphingosinicella sp. TaxID=2823234 RepID=UPI00378325AB
MTSTVLPITLTIAAAAAVLHIWLAGRVSALRNSQKVSIGDGGNEALIRRMRAHANYGENAPIFLILLALLELAGGDPRILWGAAILFVIARILHAFGMDRPHPSKLRMFGMIGSTLALVILLGYAIFTVYRHPPAL